MDSSGEGAARMRAAVLVERGTIEVDERPVPAPGPGEVLVRVSSVGVCGSDRHYYREGRIGDFVVTGPLVLGHEVSGRITAVGPGGDRDRVGQRVAIEPQRPCHRCAQCRAGRYNLCPHMAFYGTPPVDGAFCDYVTIGEAFAHPISDTVSDDAGALLEPLSVAVWAHQKAETGPGSRLLIAGAGPIGLLTSQVARALGAVDVIVSDPEPSRREMAGRFGATEVLDPVEGVAGLEVDAFIDCSGATRAVQAGISAVRGGGTIVLVGMGEDEIPMPVSLIQTRELRLTGTFRYADTWPVAEQLVAAGRVDLDALVTEVFDLEHTVDALDADADPRSVKAVIRP